MMKWLSNAVFYGECLLCIGIVYSLGYIFEIIKYCVNDKSVHGLVVCLLLILSVVYMFIDVVLQLLYMYAERLKDRIDNDKE